VCSSESKRIAAICQAIDELAGRTRDREGMSTAGTAITRSSAAARTGHSAGRAELAEATATGDAAGAVASAAEDHVASQLATIWLMIADVDPELARRLPRYLAVTD
jgi:hypothetical protein